MSAQPISQANFPTHERVREGGSDVVQRLAREVRKFEQGGKVDRTSEFLSTGCRAMDACLPQSGYGPGTVVEYLKATAACGATYLALAAAAEAMQKTDGFLVLVDRQQHLYPPALAAQGIDLKKVVWVHPESTADTIWAVDQAARTPAVAAVFAELQSLDDRAARRLQLAAESGGGLVLLLRSLAARGAPSWAEVQWSVRSIQAAQRKSSGGERNNDARQSRNQGASPMQQFVHRGYHQPEEPAVLPTRDRLLQVQLLRNRGGKAGAKLQLTIDSKTGEIRSNSRTKAKTSQMRERNRHEETSAVCLASQLASPETPSRRAASG